MIAHRRVGPTMLLACALATSGCAGATLRQSDEPTVELVVHNESTRTVTAYVQWQGLRPVRLGTLSPGRTATYLPPYRSNALCVSFLGLSNIAYDGTVPAGLPIECSRIEVERGERLDVVFRGPQICYVRRNPDC